jgi:hypothetical protein
MYVDLEYERAEGIAVESKNATDVIELNVAVVMGEDTAVSFSRISNRLAYVVLVNNID